MKVSSTVTGPEIVPAANTRNARSRFSALNQHRLRRVREALPAGKQSFLDMLSLCLQVNHPALPGFVSAETPAGVANYVPQRLELSAARKFARDFSYSRAPRAGRAVRALFLMGSGGTIALGKDSDFDFWVVHEPSLDSRALQELREKLNRIERWAAELDLEVHFFLVDEAAYRNGIRESLSSESSGTAQTYLLLDEFYRTALLVAGHPPLWWYVPPEHESQYAAYVETLRRHDPKLTDETVDLGGVALVPAEEFYGATLWQVYKGISSPYKSVIKILLTETYASEYPSIRLLSHELKERLFHGEPDFEELDPYLMMYRKVENYLRQRNENERLDVLRRCFYLKIGEALSRPPAPRIPRWRRDKMQELTNEWGWSNPQYRSLDSRTGWRIEQVYDEQRALVRALVHSYRVLSAFVRERTQSTHIDAGDISLLGRKLFVTFERKAGKVELPAGGFPQRLAEQHLVVSAGHGNTWHLFRELNRSPDSRPIRQFPSLIELLAWSYFNGLVQPQTQLSVDAEAVELTAHDIGQVFSILGDTMPRGRRPQPTLEAMASSPRVLSSALFINLAAARKGEDIAGSEPLLIPVTRRKPGGAASEEPDPLNFGEDGSVQIRSVDLVLMNAWGEISTHHHEGDTALADSVTTYLHAANRSPLPSPAIHCFSRFFTPAMVRRAQGLFDLAIEHLSGDSAKPHTRLIAALGKGFLLIRPGDGGPAYERIASLGELLNRISEPQPHFSDLITDGFALRGTPLPCIFHENQTGRVQLFLEESGRYAQVFVLDERGSLFHQRLASTGHSIIFKQYQQFFEAVLRRRESSEPGASLSAEFYFLRRTSVGYRTERAPPSGAAPAVPYLDLQVIGELEGEMPLFTIYCKGHDFSSAEHGNRLFSEVVAYVLSQRSSREPYPVYITDLDAHGPAHSKRLAGAPQTAVYLRYKKYVEGRLNEELQARLRAAQRGSP